MAVREHSLTAAVSQDEIKVKPRDIIQIMEWFDDNWAAGTNISTGQTGVFPLSALVNDNSVTTGHRSGSLQPW